MSRVSKSLIVFFFLLVAPGHPGAQNATDARADLEKVRQRLTRLQQQLAQRHEQKNTLDRQLREAEEAARGARKRLNALESDLDSERARRTELQQQFRTARDRAARSAAGLAAAVRLSYVNGPQERLRLLLNQEDPLSLSRMMTYYSYFGRFREGEIREAREALTRLNSLKAENEQSLQRLEQLTARRKEEYAGLEQARARRARLLVKLQREIETTGAQVSRLKQREADLGDLVERLQRALEAFPTQVQTPFASMRGKLPLPLEGKVTHRFGQRRGDTGLKWKGVVLQAPEGTPVRAVHQGRVAYADWLPGMGLLMVLDHGDGYMTLYGHNDALLRDAGTWVSAGEEIAEAGDTGGQDNTGVYFELRKDGKPINPGRWLAHR